MSPPNFGAGGKGPQNQAVDTKTHPEAKFGVSHIWWKNLYMPLSGVKVGEFVSVERLELSTNGLKGHCSTIELHARNEAHSIMAVILSQRHASAVSYLV
jgi:hypothetical protein